MERRLVLAGYKILGPAILLSCLIFLIDELHVITLSEDALPLPILVLIFIPIYIVVWSLPLLLVACPIIAWRFRRERALMMPAVLILLAAVLFRGGDWFPELSFFHDDERLYLILAIMFMITAGSAATWAGFAGSKEDTL